MPSAMEVIRDDWPDVVALDWWLEGREASDVIQAAHELKSRARFLIVTAHRAEDAFRQTAADGWLQKPFDPDVLAARIEELAAMGSAGQE
jgi:DNA-binding response OmpR family regulator